MRRLLLPLLLAAALLPPAAARAQPAPPLIAGASDLQFAITEIAQRFRADTGQEVRLSLGSSGNITRQIEQGSPVEMFLSADEAFVFRLADGGHTRDRGELYAIGRIVLLTPPGSPLRTADGMEAIRAALDAGQIRRFAIANPEHAPYGRAAEQALRAAGLWDRIQPHLVLGENVSQAAQFATLGEFGVVLMVGGSIPGETKTIAIAIYDRVQAFDDRGAGIMAAVLLGVSVLALGLTNTLSRRVGRRTAHD